MALEFEKGTSEAPKGHALLYFRGSPDPDEIWVTYLVILPISVDVSKYVPPFLMNQVGEAAPKDLSAFAFPPAPERLESHALLEEMAAKREDDILFGGTINPSDVPSAMMSINDAIQKYAEIYTEVVGIAGQAPEESQEETPGLAVDEVLYGLMSESDKLGELTKMVGRLRFAVEGSDSGLVEEAEQDIGRVARYLPDNLSIPQLVQAAKSVDSRGAELAELYLQRCYHLVQEEYSKLGQVEDQIKEVEGGLAPQEG